MFTQAYGEERMPVRGERRPLHACLIVHSSVHTIHTGVFGFTIFTVQLLFSAIASQIVSNWK